MASGYGVSFAEEQAELLSRFVDLLLEWSGKINLVGISDRGRIINELILDSLIPVPLLPQKGKLTDLGSGAGFPAIIIKILRPGLEMKLIEANGKKVSFLKYAIRTLHLKNITAVNSRLESVTDEVRNWGCNIVTSRAMASFDRVIGMADPLLISGGIIAGFLGKNGKEELNGIQGLLSEHQFLLRKTASYILPDKQSDRTIVILEKCS